MAIEGKKYLEIQRIIPLIVIMMLLFGCTKKQVTSNVIENVENVDSVEISEYGFEIKSEKMNKLDGNDDSEEDEMKIKLDYSKLNNTFCNLKIGDYIKFGCYREWYGGVHNVFDEELYWKILDISDNKALIHLYDNIKTGLEETCNIYDLDQKAEIKWRNNSARYFLNDTFIKNSFTNDEMDCICDTENDNVIDKVFLLNVEEITKCYPILEDRPKDSSLRDNSLNVRKKYMKKGYRVYQAKTDYRGAISNNEDATGLLAPAMWIDLEKIQKLPENRKKLHDEIIYYDENYRNRILKKDNRDYYIDNLGAEILIVRDINVVTDGDIVYFGRDFHKNIDLPFYVVKRFENQALICSMFDVSIPTQDRDNTLERIYNELFDDTSKKIIATSSITGRKIQTSDEMGIIDNTVYSKKLRDNIEFNDVFNINYSSTSDSYEVKLCLLINVKDTDEYQKIANGWRTFGRKEVKNPRLYGLYYLKDFEPLKNKLLIKDDTEYYLDEDGLANTTDTFKEIEVDFSTKINKNTFRSLYVANSPYAYQIIEENKKKLFTDKLGRKVDFCDDIKNSKEGNIVAFGKYYLNGELTDIYWRVVKKSDNEKILMSEYEFDWNKGFYTIIRDKSNYKESFVRKWLNKDFYDNAFTENEKRLIKYETVNKEYFRGGNLYDIKLNNDIKDYVYTIESISGGDYSHYIDLISSYYSSINVNVLSKFHYKTYTSVYFKSSAFGKVRPYITIYNGDDQETDYNQNTVEMSDEKNTTEQYSEETTINNIHRMKTPADYIETEDTIEIEEPSAKPDISNLDEYKESVRNESIANEKFDEYLKDLISESESIERESIERDEYMKNIPKGQKDFYERIENIKLVSEYNIYDTVDKFESVTLGKYEQDGNVSNGKEDIEWIALKRENDKVLLLSKYIIEYKYFNENNGSSYVTWTNATIRNWLNTVFYSSAFSGYEKNVIIKSNLNNYFIETPQALLNLDGLEKWESNDAIEDTSDFVFLITKNDCLDTFGSDLFLNAETNEIEFLANMRAATKATQYAKNITIDTLDYKSSLLVDDSREWYRDNSPYVLRNSGNVKNTISIVHTNGTYFHSVSISGNNNQPRGIRPAIWVKYENE